MKRGAPLRRTTPLRRGGRLATVTPIRAVSDKRRVVNIERQRVLAAMRDEEPTCHAQAIRSCTNAPDDGHEVLTRARGGSITDPANIILVCRPCHTWITDHPVEAACRGLVVPAWVGVEGLGMATMLRHLADNGHPMPAPWCPGPPTCPEAVHVC